MIIQSKQYQIDFASQGCSPRKPLLQELAVLNSQLDDPALRPAVSAASSSAVQQTPWTNPSDPSVPSNRSLTAWLVGFQHVAATVPTLTQRKHQSGQACSAAPLPYTHLVSQKFFIGAQVSYRCSETTACKQVRATLQGENSLRRELRSL